MPTGDSSLLPDPPPPRPDRREAAIGAALRRFDGIEDAAPVVQQPRPSAGPWSRSRRPQFAMAISIALIAVIGVPATWMAIRDGALTTGSPRSETSATSSQPVTMRYEPSVTSQGNAEEAQAPAPAREATGRPAPATIPARRSDAPPVAANERALDEAVAAPPPAMVAAPPPPPPPPAPAPPPAAEEKVAQGALANDTVVTGSRIRQSNQVAKSDTLSRQTVGRAGAAEAQFAPDRVLKDRAYSDFLSQLQTAIRAGNRDAVIRLIAFPLRVNSHGKIQLYLNTQSVRADYDKIFTPEVTRAILNQRVDRLFGRDQGVMIGDGEVWFDHKCPNAQCSPQGPVRITAINR